MELNDIIKRHNDLFQSEEFLEIEFKRQLEKISRCIQYISEHKIGMMDMHSYIRIGRE